MPSLELRSGCADLKMEVRIHGVPCHPDLPEHALHGPDRPPHPDRTGLEMGVTGQRPPPRSSTAPFPGQVSSVRGTGIRTPSA